MNGTHRVGRAHDVLSVYDRLGCDVIGLQETRRSGHPAFIRADFLVYCSGECGGKNGGKKEQGGVGLGLVVKSSITRAARPAVSSVIACSRLHLNYVVEPGPLLLLWRMPQLKHRTLVINTHSGRPWTGLWRRHLDPTICCVLVNANARTRRRENGGVGSKINTILGAYGRDTLNGIGELLLSFAHNYRV